MRLDALGDIGISMSQSLQIVPKLVIDVALINRVIRKNPRAARRMAARFIRKVHECANRHGKHAAQLTPGLFAMSVIRLTGKIACTMAPFPRFGR